MTANLGRDFRLFWAGETISLFGTQVTTLALPLTAVLVFDAGPGQVGLLRFLQLVPYLIGALPVGVWVDRVRRRPVMLGANLARLILIGLVPVLSWSGLLELPLLLVIGCAIGIASMVFDVSWMSYVPTVVGDRKALVQANARLAVSASSADAAGPALGGALVGALTAPTAMLFDALSYAVSIVSLGLIRAPETAPERAADRQLSTELRQGLSWVFGNRYLRYIALIGFACNFFVIANSTIFVLYAVRSRNLTPGELGLVLSVAGACAVVGAAVAGAGIARFRLGLTYRLAMAAVFLTPIVIPVAGGPKPLLIVTFMIGLGAGYFAMAIANLLILTVRQTLTPDPLMGRMSAAMRMLLFGGGSMGGPVGGALAALVGLRPALAVLATGSALMLIPVLLSPVGRLREMPKSAVAEPVAG